VRCASSDFTKNSVFSCYANHEWQCCFLSASYTQQAKCTADCMTLKAATEAAVVDTAAATALQLELPSAIAATTALLSTEL
jgi:hypothetical protein